MAPIVEDDAPSIELKEKRLKEGFCPTCGNQLYKLQTKGLIKKHTVRVPITEEGVVQRGQCLLCLYKNIDQANDMMAAAAIASMGDQQQEDVEKKPRAHESFESTVYIGPYNERKERHGKGELLWGNGDRYVGFFANGYRNGEGTLFFRDGSEYVGNWQMNKMHGEATRRFQNGDVYTGNYVQGKRSGKGRLYFANGDLYDGDWEDDQIHGFGRYYYSSGISFEGRFYDGKRQGKGKVQKPDGELEIYRYDNNVRRDPGVRWSADRKKAWRLEGGRIKRALSIAEAVALGYECDDNIDGEPREEDTEPLVVHDIS